MADVLTTETVTETLADLPGWRYDDGSITRTATMPTFLAAIAVVGDVGGVAEEMDHHPDIDIRWRKLVFRCATHSAGGVTDLDLRLAAQINTIVGKHGG